MLPCGGSRIQVNEDCSDASYMIKKAKSYQSSDSYTAQAWMLTAKTLFPNNFSVQYEAYVMAKDLGSIKEAAFNLEEMFKLFPNENQLWTEIQKIAIALRKDSMEKDVIFLRKQSEDTMEHCQLMLLLIKKFPEKVSEHGVKLLETLFAAEKYGNFQSPFNPVRKLVVYDVIPLILHNKDIQIPTKQMYRLLQKSVEFYGCYSSQEQDIDGKTAKSGSRSGDLGKEGSIEQPWTHLFSLLHAAGRKLGWELVEMFAECSETPHNSDSLWQQIMSFVHRRNPVLASSEICEATAGRIGHSVDDTNSLNSKQVFFCTVVLFLHCLCHFGTHVNPTRNQGSNQGEPHYVLVEGLEQHRKSQDIESTTSSKRRKLGNEITKIPVITLRRKASADTKIALTQSFVTSLKCWELLHSNNYLEKELGRLSNHLCLDTWPWFQALNIDSLIYQGMHQDAISQLLRIQRTSDHDFQKGKANLQLASCYYILGKFSMACERLLDVVSSLPIASGHSVAHTTESFSLSKHQSGKSGRHLSYLSFERGELLQYCVKLLITCFREKTILSPAQNDMALGHMIVLSQFDWPQEEKLFLHIVNIIRKQGSFCYSLFFNYVINADILEEFLHLTTPEGGDVTLDLLPSSTTQVGKQRAVTRGVNKGAMEDLKLAMEKQMSRADVNLEQNLVNYFKQEREQLRKNLL
ncbi:integrator complex subunit 10 isoform X2 [Tachypleus tridentatus]|uniref:integrator complex subunit 10 isoform X2 n=1 Tax=Tachypleus tridentatus TaxID=6853 RepID=UPI003FD60025